MKVLLKGVCAIIPTTNGILRLFHRQRLNEKQKGISLMSISDWKLEFHMFQFQHLVSRLTDAH